MRDFSGSHGDRKPVAAGKFYSANAHVLKNELEQLFESLPWMETDSRIRALITPHAGYMFSGTIAASAFASVPTEKEFSNIFIIGTSHRRSYDGASIYNSGALHTPIGRVSVNHKIAEELIGKSQYFKFDSSMHDDEHCIEVQLPFIQHCFSYNPPVIPILIGTVNLSIIKSLAEAIRPWFTEDNLFVISSDFSHYPSYDDAILADRDTSDAILSGKPGSLLEVMEKYEKSGVPGLSTNMCGWTSGLLLMYLSEGDDLFEYRHVMYRNSGDSTYGDKNGVVGYHSIILIEKSDNISHSARCADTDSFTEQEKIRLFRIARSSISAGLTGEKRYKVDADSYSGKLTIHAGVFVTLYIGDELRGCIGRMVSEEPLCSLVSKMAYSAAFEDPRFSSLNEEEYGSISIEISVLTPLKRIQDIDEIVIGKHGLYIRKEWRTGVLLPQVASKHNWNVIQFLEYTARYKANIGADGWKEAEIFTFETSVFNEDEIITNLH